MGNGQGKVGEGGGRGGSHRLPAELQSLTEVCHSVVKAVNKTIVHISKMQGKWQIFSPQNG